MLINEQQCWSRGDLFVAGVDEAGRGPLAGPIVIGAVILDKKSLEKSSEESPYWDIKDSKKLTEAKREEMYKFIVQEAVSYSVVVISSQEIDQEGIGKANSRGFSESIASLKIKPDHVLTDFFPVRGIAREKQTNIVKGDAKSISIAAASILAKVTRDRIMREFSTHFSVYGFDRNKGYGTAFHIRALYKHGPCEIHRRSFAPVKFLEF